MYYSMKDKPFSKEITTEFFIAFKALIDEIKEKHWLDQEFGQIGEDFGGIFIYINEDKVNNKMCQEIGKKLYPLETIKTFDNEMTFDLIQFFYKFVSLPKNNFVIDDFESQTYDQIAGKYQYTIRINRLFNNFKLSFKLEKGMIKDLHSNYLDNIYLNDNFEIPDKETQSMLLLAIKKFYSLNFDDKKIGLEKIVDVYQRISTWESDNKIKSSEMILDKISSNNIIKELLSSNFKELINLANNYMIRHTELNKIPINDEDFIEYLFYTYYNCIRFILIKYNYLTNNKTKSDDVPFF